MSTQQRPVPFPQQCQLNYQPCSSGFSFPGLQPGKDDHPADGSSRGSRGQCNGGAGSLFALLWKSSVVCRTESKTWVTVNISEEIRSPIHSPPTAEVPSYKTGMSTFHYKSKEEKARHCAFSLYRRLSPTSPPTPMLQPSSLGL